MSNFQMTLVPVQNVGLAFQQALDAVGSTGLTKRVKKAEFNRLKKTLVALRQVPDDVEITHVANGITSNGDNVIIVGYRE